MRQILTQQEKSTNSRDKRFVMVWFAFVIMAVTLLAKPKTAYAGGYDGDVLMTVEHAKDCSCGMPEKYIPYYSPGSTHKFEMTIENLSGRPQVDQMLGLTCKWRTEDHAVLQKTDGTSAWYRLEGRSDDDNDMFSIRADFSYTGYVSNGVTHTQDASGIASCSLFCLYDEFWLVEPSCNPEITIMQGTSQSLRLYARHYTLSQPYGEVDDITSWADWSGIQIRSNCSPVEHFIEATSTGELKAYRVYGIDEEPILASFEITVSLANCPQGVILKYLYPYHISGSVIRGQDVGDVFVVNNGSYRITSMDSEYTAVFCGNRGKDSKVTIPDTVISNGTEYQITAIGDRAFKNSATLKFVSVGKYVTTIGKEAFAGCTGLTSVNIPKATTKLGDSAFNGCRNLKIVSGCAGITSIGNKVFYKCEKLHTVGSKSKVVTLKNVKTIGNSAFYGCKAVKKMNLASAALTKIGDAAFQGCISMTSFNSNSVKLTTLGKKVFYGDKKLGTISLKTTKLKKSKVGSNAFKGIKSTCKFKVPKKQISIYKAVFKAKGAGNKFKISKL